MAVNSNNGYGAVDSNGRAKIGLWFYEVSNTATQYKFRVDAWIYTKWSIHDQNNGWYWDRGTSSNLTATTQYGSRDIYTTSNSSWDSDNEQKIDTGTYTYNKGHSAYWVYVAIKLTDVYSCGTMTHRGYIQIPAKTSYTITYDANGGSGAPGKGTKWYGEAYTVSSTKPTRAGYTFVNWTITATGNKVNAGGTISAGSNANYTLKANWTANKYTVTLNQQSGSGGTGSVSATYGSAMPSMTKPSRTGYTFGGYYTSTGGGGTQYYTAAGASARSWDKTAATTLYAKWTANKYTVTLNKNNGTGGTNSVTATYGSAMPPDVTAPTRTGYTFSGYNDATSGGTQYYTAALASARAWNKAQNSTLYAQWTGYNYTVIFNNSAERYGTSDITGTMSNQSLVYGTESPLTKNGFSWEYHEFVGWSVSPNGAATYTDQQKVSNLTTTNNGTVTLYAVWKELYIPPTIEILNCYRSTADGFVSDDGPILHLDFNWNIDNNIYDDNVAKSYTIEYAKKGTNDYYLAERVDFTWPDPTYGISGSVSRTINTEELTPNPRMDDEYNYTIRITMTDNVKSNSVFSTISISYFTVDFRSGGHGIAFGCAATLDDTLRCAMNARFENPVELVGNANGVANLRISGTYPNIQFKNTDTGYTKTVLYGRTGSSNGLNVILGSGGNTFVGSGESADTAYSHLSDICEDGDPIPNYVSTESEALFLTSDGAIQFYSGANTWANRQHMEFSSAGNLHVSEQVYMGATTLNLGTYVGGCVLTSSGGQIYFSIPTGRNLSHTNISKITFNICVRCSNANGNGYYIVKRAGGSADSVAFDSSKSCTFYDGNNAQKTLTTSMWTKNLNGGTNIYISLYGGDHFFSGSSTITGYCNNNAATVYLSGITVTLS